MSQIRFCVESKKCLLSSYTVEVTTYFLPPIRENVFHCNLTKSKWPGKYAKPIQSLFKYVSWDINLSAFFGAFGLKGIIFSKKNIGSTTMA